MSAATTTDDSNGIENKGDAVDAIVDGGVVADGQLAEARGEGRGRRYFLGGEGIAKGDVVEAVLEADEVVPADEAEVEERDRDGAVRFAREVYQDCSGDLQFVDEDGDAVVASLVTGGEMGYITGSHVEASPAPVDTVDGYRDLAVEAIDGFGSPDEVPIAPDGLMEEFESYGDHDEETIQQLREQNEARWEAGEYDHLRKDDSEEE